MFAFSVNLVAVSFGDVFESSLDKLLVFFYRVGDPVRVFVVSEVDELRVNKRVIDVPVAEHFHDVEEVFRLVVFHCGFPMPKEKKLKFLEGFGHRCRPPLLLVTLEVIFGGNTLEEADRRLG